MGELYDINIKIEINEDNQDNQDNLKNIVDIQKALSDSINNLNLDLEMIEISLNRIN